MRASQLQDHFNPKANVVISETAARAQAIAITITIHAMYACMYLVLRGFLPYLAPFSDIDFPH